MLYMAKVELMSRQNLLRGTCLKNGESHNNNTGKSHCPMMLHALLDSLCSRKHAVRLDLFVIAVQALSPDPRIEVPHKVVLSHVSRAYYWASRGEVGKSRSSGLPKDIRKGHLLTVEASQAHRSLLLRTSSVRFGRNFQTNRGAKSPCTVCLYEQTIARSQREL